jgi:hypothetical protein
VSRCRRSPTSSCCSCGAGVDAAGRATSRGLGAGAARGYAFAAGRARRKNCARELGDAPIPPPPLADQAVLFLGQLAWMQRDALDVVARTRGAGAVFRYAFRGPPEPRKNCAASSSSSSGIPDATRPASLAKGEQ